MGAGEARINLPMGQIQNHLGSGKQPGLAASGTEEPGCFPKHPRCFLGCFKEQRSAQDIISATHYLLRDLITIPSSIFLKFPLSPQLGMGVELDCSGNRTVVQPRAVIP